MKTSEGKRFTGSTSGYNCELVYDIDNPWETFNIKVNTLPFLHSLSKRTMRSNGHDNNEHSMPNIKGFRYGIRKLG